MTMLPGRVGRPPLYMQSPFTAELAPSLAVRQSRGYEPSLWLGLLLQGPDADGYGAVELEDGDYSRQAVELSPRSASHLTIPRLVLFDLFSRPIIKALALFNAAGALEAYGALRSATAGGQPPARFEFRSHQIIIKRPDG